MKGKQIFEQHTAEYSEYAKLLMSLRTIIGEAELFDLLEQADKQNKKLAIDESKIPTDGDIDDDISIDTIIFV
jgi:hypothetical protein